MKPALQILVIISLLSLTTPAASQESPEPPRYYDIEIIDFARDAEGAGNTEYWPPLEEPPDWSQAVSLRYDDPATKITRLPASGHRLKREYRNLRGTQDRLRPLAHLAWRQPLLSGEESPPIYIRSRDGYEPATVGGESHPELEGTVRVTGKRYLHVHLDLLLRQLTPPDLTADAPGDDVEPTDLAAYYQTYRMLDHRRMRSDRLHYIDHPMFGVLVLATPYEMTEPQAPEPPKAAFSPSPEKTDSTNSGTATPPTPSGGT